MRGEFFFDTYALIALAQDDPAYAPYRGLPVVCERYNLLEFAYKVHVSRGPERAREAVRRVRAELLEPALAPLLRAAALKARPEGRPMSYVDAVGYILAGDNGLRFLTSDRAFRTFPNVEFVTAAGRKQAASGD